jgi:flagellar biosynthesis protein FliP
MTAMSSRMAAPASDLRARLIDALPKQPQRRSLRWLWRGAMLGPVLVALGCALWPAVLMAAPTGINLNLQDGSGGVSTTLQLVALMTVLSLAPSIIIMMTSFVRIVIVLGFVRNALGTQQMPPNQVLIGVALFLTMFVMSPTLTTINDTALQPLMDKKIDTQTAIKRAEAPIRDFMFKQVDQGDLGTFMDLAKEKRPKTRADVPTRVLIPAFVISEVKTAFQIGFLILVPFLIIDMVIASTVMSMGMVMLPPVVISLPFKILLFVLVDGWSLVSESLVRGFVT